MSQKSRAIADVSVSGWTPTPVSPQINEVSPDGATSCVMNSGTNPSGDAFDVRLAALARPGAGLQVLTINLRKTDDGSVPVTLTLLQGSSVIGEWAVPVDTTFGSQSFTLTGAQVAAITDYTSLRVQVTAGGSSSSSSSSSSSTSSISGCTDCPGGAPDRYTVTLSGLSNDNCVECGDLNTTFVLSYVGFVDGTCQWRSSGVRLAAETSSSGVEVATGD